MAGLRRHRPRESTRLGSPPGSSGNPSRIRGRLEPSGGFHGGPLAAATVGAADHGDGGIGDARESRMCWPADATTPPARRWSPACLRTCSLPGPKTRRPIASAWRCGWYSPDTHSPRASSSTGSGLSSLETAWSKRSKISGSKANPRPTRNFSTLWPQPSSIPAGTFAGCSVNWSCRRRIDRTPHRKVGNENATQRTAGFPGGPGCGWPRSHYATTRCSSPGCSHPDWVDPASSRPNPRRSIQAWWWPPITRERNGCRAREQTAIDAVYTLSGSARCLTR
jgi:hypothetical protein